MKRAAFGVGSAEPNHRIQHYSIPCGALRHLKTGANVTFETQNISIETMLERNDNTWKMQQFTQAADFRRQSDKSVSASHSSSAARNRFTVPAIPNSRQSAVSP